MKKFFLLWAVLVLAAPAMAVDAVDVCAVDIGGDAVEIRYTVVSGQLPRAFALDITVDAGTISLVDGFFSGQCDDVNRGYGIFPANFNRYIDAAGPNWVDVNYTPVADVCDLPGDTQGGEDTNGITIEMGSLYVDDNSPPTSGVLCVVHITADCNMTLAKNIGRGSVVLEDGNEPDPLVFYHLKKTLAIDWGDLPDSYPTLSASGGPSHIIKVLKMGALIDPEPDGLPGPDAMDDDLTTSDDEDGVVFGVVELGPVGGTVTVTVNNACKLNAWIDFGNDGSFVGDQVFNNRNLIAGANLLNFAIPGGATLETDLFSRWRVNTAGNLNYEGPANNGEVEDYNDTYIVCHVPDVVDDTNAVAQAALLANGFTIGAVTAAFDDTIADGNVISTTPAYCNYPGCGTAVAIVVSKGPCVVPNVVTLTEAAADTAIVAAGFTTTVNYMYHDSIASGIVISQAPAPASTPGCGTAVTIDVSLGPCTLIDLTGYDEATARAAITGLGFTVGDVTYEYHNSVAVGLVISQDPGPGVHACGSEVDLVISLGPCVVPNVVGMMEAAAETAITDAGFNVGTKTPVDGGGAPIGQVVAQSPASGGTPGCDTDVDIDVSAECMANTNPDYAKWVLQGKPACWCYSKQCRGDMDNTTQGSPFWVDNTDKDAFLLNWNLFPDFIPPPGDQVYAGNICADLDHDFSGGPFWVDNNDKNILVLYWNLWPNFLPPFGPPDCSGPGCMTTDDPGDPHTCDENPLPNTEYNYWK